MKIKKVELRKKVSGVMDGQIIWGQFADDIDMAYAINNCIDALDLLNREVKALNKALKSLQGSIKTE